MLKAKSKISCLLYKILENLKNIGLLQIHHGTTKYGDVTM